MKIVVVLTYFQRPAQLLNTLKSFERYDEDFSVVIVDDNSPEDIKLPDLPFDVTILKLTSKECINPGPTFNRGFIVALQRKPDIVIIQNAECYHNGDILTYAKKNLTDKNYLSFGCYSLDKGQGVDFKPLNNRTATRNGDSAWYNHSVYRPGAYHFCTAITAKNLVKLNGFDERFKDGLGYEDDYFVHQVKSLGLKIKIVDDPFVFHQYHYDVKAFDFVQELYNANGNLCNKLNRLFEYKAKHLITPDL